VTRRSKHVFRQILSLAAAGALVVTWTACGPQRPAADLVFVNGAEPETLDPAIITGQPEGRLANALFEGLLSFGPDGRPIPGVAQSWEISDDKKTYRFHLRPGTRWSDGTPLTARDFVESWKRTLTPETGSAYNYILFPIRNAAAYADGKIKDFREVGVREIDPQTLEVTLENPTPYFLDLCAFVTLQPVPLHVVEKFGDDWIKPANIVGNGAFLLEDWRINDLIRLRRNPEYWNAKNVSLKSVDVLPIAKANTAFNFYASGQADLLMDKGLTPPSLLDELKSRKDFHAAPFLGIYFLRFNCSKPPLDDPRIRRALSLAIDKSVITTKITRAGELPATGFVPPGMQGYTSPESPGFDPEAARRLLADAGFAEGHGFPRLTYLYSEGELNEAIAVELQNMWRQHLGISVDLARQEWKVYLNSMNSLDYDICRSSWVGDYPDPMTFLDLFLAGGGNNRTGWVSSEYDRLIGMATAETDPAKRSEMLRSAEFLLVDQAMPICPLYYYVGIQLYDPDRIGGIQPNLLDEHPLKSIFRKEPASATAR